MNGFSIHVDHQNVTLVEAVKSRQFNQSFVGMRRNMLVLRIKGKTSGGKNMIL